MKIFTSYSHNDTPIIKDIASRLKDDGGQEVWWDQHLIGGDEWEKKLEQQIEQCDILLFAISPDSLASEFCEWEYKTAIKLDKKILPVKIRPTDDNNIPTPLDKIQYVECPLPINAQSAMRLMAGLHNLARKVSGEEVVRPEIGTQALQQIVTQYKQMHDKLDAIPRTQILLSRKEELKKELRNLEYDLSEIQLMPSMDQEGGFVIIVLAGLLFLGGLLMVMLDTLGTFLFIGLLVGGFIYRRNIISSEQRSLQERINSYKKELNDIEAQLKI